MTAESSLPWEADRPLTLDDARAAIATRFPAVDVRRLEHLGSGWDFDAYLTRDGWVFRFPRRADCAKAMDYERVVQRLAARVMPPTVAVPQVELVGDATSAFPYPFAGYRFIPGISVENVASHLLPTLARDLGAALGAIHSIPERTARAAGVVEIESDDFGRREWIERRLAAASALRGFDPVIDHAIDQARQVQLPLPRFAGPLRFVHNDLAPEHLIVDATTGRLAGIIDWSDAALGDAARDFVVFATWKGRPFVEEVLRSYPHPVGDDFRERVAFTARFLSVLWLAEAHEKGSDMAKHVEWVHNAFANGPGMSV